MHHYEHFWLNPTFWVAVSFVIFVALAAKTVWAKATNALDARGAKIRADLDEAEQTLARAKVEADRLSAAAAAEAEASAKRRERMAMDRIHAAEASAVAEVRNTAADIAAAAARTVIAERLDAKADAALIDKAVSDLPRALRAA
jgi:F-type H+-transporting ATPase subunit b